MNNLINFDTRFFLLLNHLPHNRLFDLVYQLLSGMGSLGIIWLVLGGILFLREEKKHHWFFAPIFLAGAGSYIAAEMVLKNLVARMRPSLSIGAIIVGRQSTDFSFPSGHATIAFAMAVVLSKIEPKWKWLLYLLAIAISFSRIYLGRHFPLDILGGAVLGWVVGHFSWRFAREVNRRFKITS